GQRELGKEKLTNNVVKLYNKSFFCTFESGCTCLCLKLVMCYEI
ncbi:MAG: hypothetical protein ACI9AB_002051, partial [Urechidicola sp.]